MACNSIPKLDEVGEAVIRRIVVIPHDAKFVYPLKDGNGQINQKKW